MKETNLERIQREVSSYDTEAGKRLRYHVTRVLACKNYKKETGFGGENTADSIIGLFMFSRTREGPDYWLTIHKGVEDMRR